MDPIMLISVALLAGLKTTIIEYIKPSAKLTIITRKNYEKTMESVMLGGIISIDVVITQAFITTNSNEILIRLSLFCFAIGIPLLAIGILLNQAIWKAGYQANSLFNYNLIKVIGVLSSFIGLIATFWHAFWLIGIAFLISGIIGILIFLIYIGSLNNKLEEDRKKIVAKKDEITSETLATAFTQFLTPTGQKETTNKNEGDKPS